MLASCSLAFHCAELGAELWFGRNCLAEWASAIKAKPSPLSAAFQQELLWAVWPRDTRVRRNSSLSWVKFGKLQLAKLTHSVRLHPDCESPSSVKNLLLQPKSSLHQHRSGFCPHAHPCCQDSSWAHLHLHQPWAALLRERSQTLKKRGTELGTEMDHIIQLSFFSLLILTCLSHTLNHN